ncbi:tripartite tricarboxylate transporter TctB family protein [Fredinandcohnia onubensis]|uniref:tripartite tricarboxylate transporter TctB family protein n=1 Tax=Fredinandcohnia onubensis TaxID=1571209 RepID=UPI00211F2569|nr:tripartite tricarboxylate transporter TctB family protein [Fredinandcohnia onubensis]
MLTKAFDRYLSIALIAVGGFFIFEGQRINESSFGSAIGPGVLPSALGVILILLCIRNIYETFRKKYPEQEKEKVHYKRFLIMLVSTILYALLLEPIGYVISTFLFLLVGFQVMQKGKFVNSIIIAAAVPAVVYYMYVVVMKGTLPSFPVWLSM